MKIFSIFLGVLLTVLSAVADTSEQREEHYNLKGDGLAIEGYDPVAYFSGEPKKGHAEHSHTLRGVRYHFSSEGNLAKFKTNPTQYEPQYGSWCAYAFALKAGKVKINPKAYKIVNGKLYLFYKTLLGGDTLKKWNTQNDLAQIKIAESEWQNQLAQK